MPNMGSILNNINFFESVGWGFTSWLFSNSTWQDKSFEMTVQVITALLPSVSYRACLGILNYDVHAVHKLHTVTAASLPLMVWFYPMHLSSDLGELFAIPVQGCNNSLGAALLQPAASSNGSGDLHWQPVAYSSCFLAHSEQRYEQIERETKAIIHPFHKFD